MSKKSTREKFTKEFKADAIKLVTEQGYNCSEGGWRLGVGSSNISRWGREYCGKQENYLEGGVSRRDLEEELRRLRKENKRLYMEREIFKKAAASFAKESGWDTTLSDSNGRPTPSLYSAGWLKYVGAVIANIIEADNLKFPRPKRILKPGLE